MGDSLRCGKWNKAKNNEIPGKNHVQELYHHPRAKPEK
jgi:hypothetical protein